ncbi:fimbrial protein [Lelliottia nimipressuralis]|uniref:fimbrial protein n=1 Tax=Lelliottia nimipressuralis TaxID=69220 RepID=UPI003D2815D2
MKCVITLMYSALFILLQMNSVGLAATLASTSKVSFNGTLVEDACTLAPGQDGENIVVKFDDIALNHLYVNQRSEPKEFQIQLLDCDVALVDKASFTFEGQEDPELAGCLALDPDSAPKHIAIDIADVDGKHIPLNTKLPGYQLVAGANQFTFSATVVASPAGIQNHSINVGPFLAVSTFEISYQ